jgi:hypothetical protein
MNYKRFFRIAACVVPVASAALAFKLAHYFGLPLVPSWLLTITLGFVPALVLIIVLLFALLDQDRNPYLLYHLRSAWMPLIDDLDQRVRRRLADSTAHSENVFRHYSTHLAAALGRGESTWPPPLPSGRFELWLSYHSLTIEHLASLLGAIDSVHKLATLAMHRHWQTLVESISPAGIMDLAQEFLRSSPANRLAMDLIQTDCSLTIRFKADLSVGWGLGPKRGGAEMSSGSITVTAHLIAAAVHNSATTLREALAAISEDHATALIEGRELVRQLDSLPPVLSEEIDRLLNAVRSFTVCHEAMTGVRVSVTSPSGA